MDTRPDGKNDHGKKDKKSNLLWKNVTNPWINCQERMWTGPCLYVQTPNAMPLKLNKSQEEWVKAPVLKVPSGKAQESSLNPEPSLLSSRQTFKTFHLDYFIHRSVSENYVIIVFFRKLERAYLVLAFRGKVAFSGSIRAACKHGMPMQWSELPERKTIIKERRGASTSIFPDLFSCFDLYFMTGE